MHKVIPETYPSMSSQKKVKIFPTFRLGDDDLPELADMEVGKKYTLVMEVEVKSKSQGSEWSEGDTTDKSIRATFKVMSVGCESDDKNENIGSGKDFEMEYAGKRAKAASKK